MISAVFCASHSVFRSTTLNCPFSCTRERRFNRNGPSAAKFSELITTAPTIIVIKHLNPGSFIADARLIAPDRAKGESLNPNSEIRRREMAQDVERISLEEKRGISEVIR